jgi:hypothetical protein
MEWEGDLMTGLYGSRSSLQNQNAAGIAGFGRNHPSHREPINVASSERWIDIPLSLRERAGVRENAWSANEKLEEID